MSALRLRTALNYAYFRWRIRHHRPSGPELQIFKALNYSKASMRFMEDAAKSNPLLKCAVDPGDTILDVGGYRGEWATDMRSRYDAFVHVFEPNPKCFASLEETFSADAKVAIYPYGLAGRNEGARLSLAEMGSSVCADSPAERGEPEHCEIELRDVREVFNELGLSEIGLLKVNIEGGEYDLLDRMIDCGLHARCKYIRIQFHEWYPDARRRRKQIVEALARTHETEWSYPFVWESWQRRDV